jgi:hypothetical protein
VKRHFDNSDQGVNDVANLCLKSLPALIMKFKFVTVHRQSFHCEVWKTESTLKLTNLRDTNFCIASVTGLFVIVLNVVKITKLLLSN